MKLILGPDEEAPSQVIVDPRLINQDEFTVAELRCSAYGNPEPLIQWRRLDGRLSTDVVNRDGYLRFNSLRKADEGSYQCIAHNSAGELDVIVPIYVREQVVVRPPPPQRPTPPQRPPQREEVSIEPSQYSGEAGQEVKLYCISNPPGTVTWTKAGSVELPQNAFVSGEELTIEYPTADNSGRYVCIVRFSSGVVRQSIVDVDIIVRSNE